MNPHDVLTEPQSITELAAWFHLGRRAMRNALDEIPGACRVGGLWRVPVRHMPPSYLLDAGLIVPQPVDAPICATLVEEAEPYWPNPYLRTPTTEPTDPRD